jgi:hypothetical protein
MGIAMNSVNLALLYAQQGEFNQALPLAKRAVEIFDQLGSPNAQYARELLSQIQAVMR